MGKKITDLLRQQKVIWQLQSSLDDIVRNNDVDFCHILVMTVEKKIGVHIMCACQMDSLRFWIIHTV